MINENFITFKKSNLDIDNVNNVDNAESKSND